MMTEWHFSCSCGELLTVSVEQQPDPEKTLQLAGEIARHQHGWVAIWPESILCCSPKCWNKRHETRYIGRTNFCTRWWEQVPNGRAKHNCDCPPCNCKRHWHQVSIRNPDGTRRVVKLLDSGAHDDGCWWGLKGDSKGLPHPSTCEVPT